MVAKVPVLYYSSYGHVETLAHEIAAGASEAGATVDVKRVPEIVPQDVAKASGYKLDQIAPVADKARSTRSRVALLMGPRRSRVRTASVRSAKASVPVRVIKDGGSQR